MYLFTMATISALNVLFCFNNSCVWHFPLIFIGLLKGVRRTTRCVLSAHIEIKDIGHIVLVYAFCAVFNHAAIFQFTDVDNAIWVYNRLVFSNKNIVYFFSDIFFYRIIQIDSFKNILVELFLGWKCFGQTSINWCKSIQRIYHHWVGN
jgi:hypothetical protein